MFTWGGGVELFILHSSSWAQIQTVVVVQHAVKVISPLMVAVVLIVAHGPRKVPQSTADTANVLGFSIVK